MASHRDQIELHGALTVECFVQAVFAILARDLCVTIVRMSVHVAIITIVHFIWVSMSALVVCMFLL